MAGEPRHISILGATGSVGRNTVDLIVREPDRFTVEAVTANKDVAGLTELAVKLGASCAVIADPLLYADLKEALAGSGIEALAGPDAVVEAAGRPSDWVMAAITGAAGLRPVLEAIRARRRRGACQQGGFGLRRKFGHGGGCTIGRPAAAGRFRAQCYLSGL